MTSILGVNVHCSSYSLIVAQCLDWAKGAAPRALVFANVHVVMEAFDNHAFRTALNSADLVNPDGVPLVWALRMLGHRNASRVYGPDFMNHMLQGANDNGMPIAFLGGSPDVLCQLISVVHRRFPQLNIAAAISPPFRMLTSTENECLIAELRASGARIVFIGLGCPKQERWMIDNYRNIPAVCCAVGAAFDFLAGTKPQAPRWIMRIGFEWLFRLLSEPRRLFRRYIRHNPRFIFYLSLQLFREISRHRSGDLSPVD